MPLHVCLLMRRTGFRCIVQPMYVQLSLKYCRTYECVSFLSQLYLGPGPMPLLAHAVKFGLTQRKGSPTPDCVMVL